MLVMSILRGVACASVLGLQFAPERWQVRYDLAIRGGTVIDGSGGAPYSADIGITAGRITAIGTIAAGEAREIIDATGLVVAPGFINLHSHAELRALGTAENMLTQGVTTEILNADGGGPSNIDMQLSALESRALAVNAGVAIGFNAVWQQVMGATDRRPTPADITDMQQRITSGLEAGAYAVSAGLDYKPAYFATEDEAVQVLEVARRWRTNFPNHDRVLASTGYSARAAVQETMRIAARSGLVPVVTHMKVTGTERGTAAVVLGEMSTATERGNYTAADVYPYLAGMTSLHALLIPGWAQDGGPGEMRKRFADASVRRRIISETDQIMAGRFTGADGVLVLSTNRTLSSYMQEFNTPSAGDAIVRILEKDLPAAILGFGDERDLVRILQHPESAISCDCGATVGATGHPRNAGTFPRVLGRYVREQGALSLEEAVRKMTALPAAIVGIIDRGYLAVGMHADITVFNALTVIDHATFDAPAELSIGVQHVVVNGQVALTDGRVTGRTGGTALRRRTWMPSRPMRRDADRRVVLHGTGERVGSGTVERVTIALDVSQLPPAAGATGTIRVTDGAGRVLFEATHLGVAQTAKEWGTVSGLARVSGSEEVRAFTATVEQQDPFLAGRPRSLTIDVAGAPLVRWILR